MQSEHVPIPPSPEPPPQAPYDPPEPAPQAIAWRRALGVVMAQAPRQHSGLSLARAGRSRTRGLQYA
jgi:hypothetical protein